MSLIDIIKEKVMEKVIEKSPSNVGTNLHEAKLSVMEFKEVFYDTLFNIELEQLKNKWSK